MGFNLEDSLREQGFKKLEVNSKHKNSFVSKNPQVRLFTDGKSSFSFIFNTPLVRLAELHVGDRFNLMASDNQFAFVPDELGVLVLRSLGRSSTSLIITNKEAYVKILTRLKDKNKKEFLACVENGVIKLDL